ncbi:MAG: DUF5615 family PIN-like protein [Armatimonadota bacterium]|nr:DUF5615 family PIN-like protein [bacterium]
MKLLLDQGLPRSAAKLLCKAGIETIHVGEIGAARWTDAEILRKASEDNLVIITLDADFHALLAVNKSTLPSVIRIRIEGLRGEAIAGLLQSVIKRCTEDLKQGVAITVQESRLRIRRLPLVK